MRVRATNDGDSGDLISISPLVDVLFILIIFFLVATKFAEEERDVPLQLPRATEGSSLSATPDVAIINVREDGSIFLGNKPITLTDLQAAMAESVATNPAQKVLVRGDENARHGTVAQAVLACHNAGVAEANIGYELPH